MRKLVCVLTLVVILTGCRKEDKEKVQPYVILLDYDGETLNGLIPFASAGLTDKQKDTIIKVIRHDYRDWAITVTTDAALYNSAAPGKKQKVVIANSNPLIWDKSGGFAFRGSFFWVDNLPCFVFVDLLKTIPRVARASTHEIGHTIGLWHQYDTEPAIMGRQFEDSKAWWVAGMATDSINRKVYQDDYKIITEKIGFK